MKKSSALSDAVTELLGTAAVRPGWRRPWVWSVLGCVLLLVGVVVYQQTGQTERQRQLTYVTEVVKRGDITLTVAANGTLQPTRSVNIGSELSGTVKSVLVDVNDKVKPGQVLVELDTAKLADQVTRSRAALVAAQATLDLAHATAQESRAHLKRLEELSKLSGGQVPSAIDLDAARATVERAIATENNAQAVILQTKATLSTDETNLSKASIRSPMAGVVLARSVDPGNAVAASLQAVTLFTIAEDLHRMRVEVGVDEADVGAVQVGQKARFTVSAYPARSYPAAVTRVAFGPTKTDNVITYTTYLEVENGDLSLRPGMTASANIVATERHGVLLVPNTALRFTPARTEVTAPSLLSKLMPGSMPVPKKTSRSDNKAGVKKVWLLRDGEAVSVVVQAGISDGRVTEIVDSELHEGDAVIVDQRHAGVHL